MKKRKKRIFLISMGLFFAIIVLDWLPDRTTKNESAANGVYELLEISLGNSRQTIMLRGNDSENPILLFLHGGPGFASISYIKNFQEELERNYVVVNWDQRGAGKSFSLFLDSKSMNEPQILEDLNQLVDYLRLRFDQEKVYIAGHSWGTILGKDYIQQYPEKVEAYISIGQYVSERESSLYSYQFLIEESQRMEDLQTQNRLKELGPPPYHGDLSKERDFRNIINAYNGNEVRIDIQIEMAKGAFFEPEYSWLDLFRLMIGNYYSIYHLHPPFSQRDFRQENLNFEVPIFFVMGEWDLVTNHLLAQEYFDMIYSPEKSFYYFTGTAHEPHVDEEEKFAGLMNGLLERR